MRTCVALGSFLEGKTRTEQKPVSLCSKLAQDRGEMMLSWVALDLFEGRTRAEQKPLTGLFDVSIKR